MIGVPIVAQWVKSPTSVHEDEGLIPGPTRWVKDLMLPQTAVYGSDLALLWLWCRLAVAALIQPLAMGVAIKRKRK